MDIMGKTIKVNELCKGVILKGEEFYFKALDFFTRITPVLVTQALQQTWLVKVSFVFQICLDVLSGQSSLIHKFVFP